MVWSMSAFVQQFVYRAEGRRAHVKGPLIRGAHVEHTPGAAPLQKWPLTCAGRWCAVLGLNQSVIGAAPYPRAKLFVCPDSMSVRPRRLSSLHELPSTSSDWTARQPHARGWLG
jgi:hypothetical protein